MTDPLEIHVPDEELSAYLDAELDAAARDRAESHLAICPHCVARLADFAALSADFARLPGESLGYDLAGVIAGRIAATPPRRPQRRAPGWQGLWPLGLGAAASVALGIVMGVALLPGGGATLSRPAMLSVFDPIPPGSLCPGPESCYARGALRSGAIR